GESEGASPPIRSLPPGMGCTGDAGPRTAITPRERFSDRLGASKTGGVTGAAIIAGFLLSAIEPAGSLGVLEPLHEPTRGRFRVGRGADGRDHGDGVGAGHDDL